jgi:hypothetical protein
MDITFNDNERLGTGSATVSTGFIVATVTPTEHEPVLRVTARTNPSKLRRPIV